ncbi:MFS transporter [[Kitasatospora] papulosa]|uniref:MFS transporter n=1 Tax=Streptomyces TaxID=1883 RepID=UPI0004C56F16|nr:MULTISPECIES: MFS transporter [Streptomyces]MDF9868141.1 MFS family permease [Streptomyces pratensis]MCY1655363.1 MFS transporter [Streptomyces sp. SL203]MCY1677290.1 MFS transporter [Streptomyces sp. SL294]MDX3180985.1 MFS transporter [Streptomyces sp. ME02-7008A-1]MDX3301726.1 MFS transporter [Streptomyces sp. ME02-7008A]
MTAGPGAAGSAAPPHRAALAVLAGACGLFALLQLGVATLLPQIQEAFGVSGSEAAWVVTGHLLVGCVATPVVSRFGDLYGRRAVMLCVLAVVAVASVVSALTGSFTVLLVARLVQGVAGGLFPLCVGLLREGFPQRSLSGPSGLLSASFGTGGGVGIVLAGMFGGGLPAVRWLFAAAALLAVVLLVAGASVLPETPRRPATRIDIPGLLLLGTVSTCLLLALTRYGQEGLGSVTGAALLAAAAAGCALLLRVERRSPEPVLDMRLMSRRPLLCLNLVSLLTGLVMFQIGVLAPALVAAPRDTGYGLGAGGAVLTLVMLPMQLGALSGGLLSGWLRESGRLTARAVMGTSTALFAAGAVVFAVLPSGAGGLALGTALNGLATGLLGGAMAELLVQASPTGATAVTVGLNGVLRNLGGAFGVQVSSMVLAVAGGASSHPSATAYHALFTGSALLALVAVGAAVAFPRSPAPRQDVPVPPGHTSRPIRPTT